MEETYRIKYHKKVFDDDMRTFSIPEQKNILSTTHRKLSKSPEIFGKPLRKSLKGYRSLRVGMYRVVFRIEKKEVLVFSVAHRKIVYNVVEKRI